MNKPTYEQLQAQVKQLAAENAALKAACSSLISKYMANRGSDSEFIACFTPEKSTIGTGGVWDMWRSLERLVLSASDNDSILASLRAEGVEMAVEAAKPEVASEFQRETFDQCVTAAVKYPQSDLAGKVEMLAWLELFAAQLRSKSEVQS